MEFTSSWIAQTHSDNHQVIVETQVKGQTLFNFQHWCSCTNGASAASCSRGQAGRTFVPSPTPPHCIVATPAWESWNQLENWWWSHSDNYFNLFADIATTQQHHGKAAKSKVKICSDWHKKWLNPTLRFTSISEIGKDLSLRASPKMLVKPLAEDFKWGRAYNLAL